MKAEQRASLAELDSLSRLSSTQPFGVTYERRVDPKQINAPEEEIVTIRAIELTNFKGIGSPVRVELRPITLLFGANSAGKSTVLQALLYIREILERRNTDPDRTQQGGPYVDLGGFRNLVHNHDLSLPVTIKCELDLKSVDISDYFHGYRRNPYQPPEPDEDDLIPFLSGATVSSAVILTIRWSELQQVPIQADYEVHINEKAAARIRIEPSQSGNYIVEFNELHPWFGGDAESWKLGDQGPTDRTLPAVQSSPEPIANTVSWYAVPVADADIPPKVGGEIRTVFDEIQAVLDHHLLIGDLIPFALVAPGRYLLEQLRKLLYLGPIREMPARNYQRSLSPEESRWATGLGAWDWICDAPKERITEINGWLTRGDRLNCGYRIDVKRYKEIDADGMLMLALRQGSDLLDKYQAIREEIEARPTKARVVIRREQDFLEVSPQDVGIGISQVIPVLVAALDQSERITVIEQPELHIHPVLQVALGDLFIESIHGEGLHRQFLIETHSEHLLLRLLRRVRETVDHKATPRQMLHPDEVAIYFVETGDDGVRIRFLTVDENGRFSWPHGFFDEREKEFFGDPGSVSDEDPGENPRPMIYEFAVFPGLFSSEDRITALYMAFGMEAGRLVSDFPQKQWATLASKVIEKSAANPDERRRWTAALMAVVKRASYRRQGAGWDKDLSWIENAVEEHKRRPFRGILHSEVSAEAAVIRFGIDIAHHSNWNCPGSCHCPRIAAEVVQTVVPMLEMSTTLVLVDPHFWAVDWRWQNVLLRFTRYLSETPIRPQITHIHYITRTEEKMSNKETERQFRLLLNRTSRWECRSDFTWFWAQCSTIDSF